MTANNTLLYKDAVGKYEDFIATPIAVESIASTIVYSGTRDSQDKPEVVPNEVWTKEVYRILLRHYRNYEIAYDNVDDFLDMLWERLEVHAPNYYQRKYQYGRLLQMSDKELLDNGEQISNYIEHTDDPVDNVFDKLKNLTNQNQSKAFGAFAQKVRNQIYNSQMDLIRDFCRKFEGLFILIGCSSNYYG